MDLHFRYEVKEYVEGLGYLVKKFDTPEAADEYYHKNISLNTQLAVIKVAR